MTARVIDLAAYRDERRRRDALLPYVAMGLVCCWPVFLAVAAGIGVVEAVWLDRRGGR